MKTLNLPSLGLLVHAITPSYITAEPLHARQAASTSINESTILFTIQTQTSLSATAGTRYTNSTTSSSTPSTTTTASSISTSASLDAGPLTSIAYSTFTIPLSGGRVTTSTAFAAPSSSTSSKVPTVQSAGAKIWRRSFAGVVGAVGVGMGVGIMGFLW